MSEENVEIVRRFLHAFVQGDYEASTEHIGAEVVLWSDPRANMETQQVRGRQAVTASIGRFVSSFDDYWCAEPDELIYAGDWVVVVMRSGGRGPQTAPTTTTTEPGTFFPSRCSDSVAPPWRRPSTPSGSGTPRP